VFHVDFHLENLATSTSLELLVYNEAGVLLQTHQGTGVVCIPLLKALDNNVPEEVAEEVARLHRLCSSY
jgi:hypothetical protein